MTQKTESECAEFIRTLPPPPEGLQLLSIHSVPDPDCRAQHFYTIGNQHVAWAADHFGGMLGEEAIADAEKNGIHCYHQEGYGRGRCQLPYSEHKTVLTLFIQVPPHAGDLNQVPGLGKYLASIKQVSEEFGVKGFGLPMRKG